MIIHNCDQGSDEWHKARAGVITASNFHLARKIGAMNDQQERFVSLVRSCMSQRDAATEAGYKAVPRSDIITRALDGEDTRYWSDVSKDYAFRLAVERIDGNPLDGGFETWAMKRGREMEQEARMEHEIQAGEFVDECGFVTTDDGIFGASADGLIGLDGGAEYKCFLDPSKLRHAHLDNDPGMVLDQVMGGLWITGRDYWMLGMYCPALKSANRQLWLRRYERDEDYINKLESCLMEFKDLVDSYEKTLRSDVREAA